MACCRVTDYDSFPFTPSALSSEGGDGKKRVFCHPSALRRTADVKPACDVGNPQTLILLQIKNVDERQSMDLNTVQTSLQKDKKPW